MSAAIKALPVRLERGVGHVECPVEEATHVTLNIPGPTGLLTLPVILRGTREGTGCWTWNGSVDAPTLRPSVLTQGHSETSNGPFRCHSWINDGAAQFLDDCSHDLANKTVPLLDVPQQCKACHGDGHTNEGDPEIGNALFACKECNGTGRFGAAAQSQEGGK